MNIITILLTKKLGTLPQDIQQLLKQSERYKLERIREEIFELENLEQVKKYLD